MTELPCIVRRVQFRNDKGFAVLACELDTFSAKYKPEMEGIVEHAISEKYQSFTVSLGMLDSHEDPADGQYVFVGDFVVSPKYGPQFKAEFYYQDAPTTEDGLKVFLMSLPNIKESRSDAIIKRFGVEGTMDILDNNPEALLEISGINAKRLPAIVKAWQEKKCMRELYTFLLESEIPISWADRIFKEWGKESLTIINENPYRLVEIYGIGFLTADKIAHKVLESVPLESRIAACMNFVLEEATWGESNLCMPYADLKKNVVGLILKCDEEMGKENDSSEILATIPKCLKANLKLFSAVKNKEDGSVSVYLKKVLERERFIAAQIWSRKEFDKKKNHCDDYDLADAEASVSKHNGRKISLDETQKQAIKSAFEHKMTVITGGGGTGKSTICQAIFHLAQKKGLTIRMMSPTGKAAQVLSDKTGCGASTVHRSLKLKPGDDLPKEKIMEDIVILDETSMSGIDTMFPIFSAIEQNLWGNIVFVGDKNQLPSVSPGNFLSDMIASGALNVITLDKVHRQSETSFIPVLANEIAKGKVVSIPSNATDITWIDLNPDDYKNTILKFVKKYVSDGNDLDDLQIISPRKQGLCGVFRTNEMLQEEAAKMNKTVDQFIQRGFSKFHVCDRVMQVVNNYDKMVFNGDMGYVIDIGEKVRDSSTSDKSEKYVTVKFYNDTVTYIGDEIDEIHLAWALTVHKCQGSQFKYILFVMAGEAQMMMSKELVYTAFSRAETHLTVVGHQNMLRIAPTRSAIRKRYTNLVKFIEEAKTGRKIFEIMQ